MNETLITIDMNKLAEWQKEHTRNITRTGNKEELNDVDIRLISKELNTVRNVKDFLESVCVKSENSKFLIHTINWMKRKEMDTAQEALLKYVEPIVNQPLPEMPSAYLDNG